MQILSAAVKETLGRFNAVPSIDFDTEGMPDIPAFENSPYTVALLKPVLTLLIIRLIQRQCSFCLLFCIGNQ